MVHAFKNVFVREEKGNPLVKGGRRKIKVFHPDGAKYQFENDNGTVLTIEVRKDSTFATYSSWLMET